MNKVQIILDKIKVLALALVNKVKGVLNTAFPNVTHKRLVLGIVAGVEWLIAHLIACIDIGIWVGDCSIPGIIGAYWEQKRFFPIWLFLLLGGGLLIALYFYLAAFINGNTGRGFTISDSNVYGSARDINEDELREVAEIKSKEAAMGAILGQLDETETRLITTKSLPNFNRNFLCLAPPGSGKTFAIVLPAIIQAIRRGESIITTDTKGEIWAKTVEVARLHGYEIRRFDLKSPNFSDGWDILSEIRMDVDRACVIAQVIMQNTGQEKDIHAAAEEALLTAICLYTVFNPAIPEHEKTLYNAYAMLFQGATALDALFNSIKDDPDMSVAFEYYATYIQGSANLRGNIITNLLNRLSPLSNPPIRNITSTPDIDLTLPGTRKCIYYVEMNDQINNKKFLSSLFFSFVFLDLCDCADSRDDQVLPIPVNVIVEEAYACGYLPTITNALSTVRSRGISITLIAQGIDQFKILYGPEMTNVILDCCATYACLGANSKSTAELFEWLGGNATVKVKTEQHTVGEGPLTLGRQYSTGDGRQALYTSNDVRKIKFRHILLVWQRYDPIMAHTFGIDRHPEYLKGNMPKISGMAHVPLADKDARAYLRAKEEQRIADYEEWIAEGGNPWDGYIEPVHNGPTTKRKMPRPIPYPELEQEALAYSAQLRGEKQADLLDQLSQTDAVAPPPGCEPPQLPENYDDIDNEYGEDEEDPNEALVFIPEDIHPDAERLENAPAQNPANQKQPAPEPSSEAKPPADTHASAPQKPAPGVFDRNVNKGDSDPKSPNETKRNDKGGNSVQNADPNPQPRPASNKPSKRAQGTIILDDTPQQKSYSKKSYDDLFETTPLPTSYDDIPRHDPFKDLSKPIS